MEPTTRERITENRRAILSSLWIFVLLNMLFRDVHEIVKPGAIEEYASMAVSEETFLAAGVALSAFISMIVVSRVVSYRAARWANVGVAIVAIGSMLMNTPTDLDDVWFLGVQVIGLLAIAGLAWTWRSDTVSPADLQDVRPMMA